MKDLFYTSGNGHKRKLDRQLSNMFKTVQKRTLSDDLFLLQAMLAGKFLANGKT